MSVYDDVTRKIVEAIEKGAATGNGWKMQWHSMSSRPENVMTGKAYQGVNTLHLWIEAQARCFSGAKWGTFKHWSEVGAKVRKGERGSLVVFLKPIMKAAEGEEQDDKKFILRTSVVFNAEQVEGYNPPLEFVQPVERLDEVDMFVQAVPGLQVRHGGDRAFYHTTRDYIQMPERGDFFSMHGYYSTLLHECAHWTGHESRLNREFGKRFGDQAYALEELVAELSAAFSASQRATASTSVI
ncbi:ArdC family protein [Pseudotabrizicola sp. L79]|uniref:ArdC family protein n=1 Tax=Pseudotabrizicola sp. L79 TaxID=3118402 RepID=UPI002F934D40